MTHRSALKKLCLTLACLALISPVMAADHDEKMAPAEAGVKNAPAKREIKEPAKAASVDLEHVMKSMGRAFKKLDKQIKDSAQNASSLKLLVELQSGAIVAKTQMPEKIESLAAAERDKKQAEYRKMMIGLTEELLKTEELLLEGNNEKAAEQVTTLKEMMKTGHDEFKQEEEEHGEHKEHAEPGKGKEKAGHDRD